ncbi:MAG: hypothetical protein Kow0065_05770 [Methylomicrobium sp.]
MQEVKMPGPMRLVWGCLACYWLADIVNRGFYTSAVILLLMIPVLWIEQTGITFFASSKTEEPTAPPPVDEAENEESPTSGGAR